MRKIATRSSHRTTLRLVGTGEGESGSAYSPFGPVRAGLITTQRTNEDQVLTELLNYLERLIQDLNFKSFEAYDTFNIAMEEMRAALSDITSEDGTEDVVK